MKMISFRDLIDLEPKPKKVKYDNIEYIWDGIEYVHNEMGMVFDEGFIIKHKQSNLINDTTLFQMKEQNIEIIEEDKHFEIYSDFSSTQNGMTKKDREMLDNNFRGIDIILKELLDSKGDK